MSLLLIFKFQIGDCKLPPINNWDYKFSFHLTIPNKFKLIRNCKSKIQYFPNTSKRVTAEIQKEKKKSNFTRA